MKPLLLNGQILILKKDQYLYTEILYTEIQVQEYTAPHQKQTAQLDV